MNYDRQGSMTFQVVVMLNSLFYSEKQYTKDGSSVYAIHILTSKETVFSKKQNLTWLFWRGKKCIFIYGQGTSKKQKSNTALLACYCGKLEHLISGSQWMDMFL